MARPELFGLTREDHNALRERARSARVVAGQLAGVA